MPLITIYTEAAKCYFWLPCFIDECSALDTNF